MSRTSSHLLVPLDGALNNVRYSLHDRGEGIAQGFHDGAVRRENARGSCTRGTFKFRSLSHSIIYSPTRPPPQTLHFLGGVEAISGGFSRS